MPSLTSCAHLITLFGRSRLLRVERGQTSAVRLVERYCETCRLVLEPLLDLDVYVIEETCREDQANARIRTSAAGLVGVDGNVESLRLPCWEHLGDLRDIPIVARSALFQGFATMPRSNVRGRLRHLLGIPRSGNRCELAVPNGLAPAFVDDGLVEHYLHPDRFDADHLESVPLVARTVAEPWEVWERPISPEHDKPSRVYLAAYRVGLSVRNHLVVVSSKKSRVVSAYFVTGGPHRLETQRVGTLLYVGWVGRLES